MAREIARSVSCRSVDSPYHIVVTREDDPFQPITGGVFGPWDPLAGRSIDERAGGTYPSMWIGTGILG